jgi:pimeloyl-ACP methyl ester carboxylesterase
MVHGAANSALIWSYWYQALNALGWPAVAVVLRGHERGPFADLATVSMRDYAEDVARVVRSSKDPPIVMGWSMGGLVAMMVAASLPVAACVGLAPSMPARRTDSTAPLRTGVFGPEEYGITSSDPATQPAMPDLDLEEREVALASLTNESRLARDERRAGIEIHALSCPLLIVTGTEDRQWPHSAYAGLWLGADFLEAQGASHWGLVLNRRVLERLVPAVVQWLETNLRQ